MNGPLLPEILSLCEASPQGHLPLATEGVLRYVWDCRFGPMLIEVIDGVAHANEERVDLHSPQGTGEQRPQDA